MNSAKAGDKASDLTVAHTLAALLERLDNSAVAVGADQYRAVVTHLVHELETVESDDALGSLLDAHPAAAQVYENLNYQHAGLCRSSLDFSVAAEVQAKAIIERVKRGAAG